MNDTTSVFAVFVLLLMLYLLFFHEPNNKRGEEKSKAQEAPKQNLELVR